MARIHIDGKSYDVDGNQNLLHAIISLGIDLPYFCWHPALGSVGACRQCAVIQYKDENDDKGKLVLACMVQVEDGLRVSVDEKKAAQFRSNIIEWLMVNHPHDCPVCDEGGECHLQDMTVMSGHNYRNYRFNKRTFRNQDLGPFIFHEMNRCITCYRCVRFYRDFAGGTDLNSFGAHDHVYFGRYEDGTLENEFSGNLVEVCPTGVFTDKTLRKHYTRKWDLQSAPSVCHHCSLGCNILVGERYNKAVRILNRYNYDVNGYFICDRGRFGYEHVNSDRRVTHPTLSDNVNSKQTVDVNDAVAALAGRIKDEKVIGIGSPRASLESNFALKTLVGDDNYSTGMRRPESVASGTIAGLLRESKVNLASLHDVAEADAVFLLGEDLTNTAPMLALSVRQAVRNAPLKRAEAKKIPKWNDSAAREFIQHDTGPFYIAVPYATKLDDLASRMSRLSPLEIARLGFAVAHEIDSSLPGVTDLDDDAKQLAREIAQSLLEADRPVIIGGISLGEPAIVDASVAAYTALARKKNTTKLTCVFPECNSLGAGLIGGMDLDEAAEKIDSGQFDTVIVLENDIAAMLGSSRAGELLRQARHVVTLDCLATETVSQAELSLPSAAFPEADGTMINNEGRAQRFFQALTTPDEQLESWQWLTLAGKKLGVVAMNNWNAYDPVASAALSAILPGKSRMEVAPDAGYRIHGRKVARSPHRYSGRTAMVANRTVHEPKPPQDDDAPLSFSMEGVKEGEPSSLIPFYWAPGWNSVQALSHYQKEVGQELRGGDSGVRLFHASDGSFPDIDYLVPKRFDRESDGPLAIPIHRIFGSEILSNHSAPVQERIPEPFCAMNSREAANRNAEDGDAVNLNINGRQISLQFRTDDSIPDGVIGIMVCRDGKTDVDLPSSVKIEGRNQ